MLFFVSLFWFLIGLAIGSFLNVVIDRSIRGESFRGRSRCEACGHTLTLTELIPLVSYLIQKERCRACGAVLSLQYPLVEFGTAVSFAVAVFSFPLLSEGGRSGWGISPFWFLQFSAILIGISTAIVIFVVDVREKIIPNGAVLILGVLGALSVAFRVLSAPYHALNRTPYTVQSAAYLYDIGFALFFACLFAVLWFVSRGRWMGFGDVKLIFATSLIIGFPASLAAFFFSFWLGGIAGIIVVLLGRGSAQTQLPFGPFILIGTASAYFLSPWFMRVSGFSLFL